MADRIFPTNVNEDPIDSEMVFQGINWDTFNERLAENKEAKKGVLNPGLAKYIKEKQEAAKGKKKAGSDDEEEAGMDHEAYSGKDHEAYSGKGSDKKADITNLFESLSPADKEKVKNVIMGTTDEDHGDKPNHVTKKKTTAKECTCAKKPCTCGYGSKTKTASGIVFTHPSQLSAEAVEAAIAADNEPLKNAILAARHDRRVRLASKVEEMINVENEKNEKLAQRRAYRESLVQRVASAENAIKTAKSTKSQKVASENPVFVKGTELSSEGKRAFAQKAISAGFPIEYVEAMIGSYEPSADNTTEIREVMSSELNKSVKMAAVKSMVREATLTDADYSRLIDYWTNELGYGDREWVESLFTKKYDKKS